MPKPFAAFDVDGTIFKSSLAEKIVEEGIAEGLFRKESFERVHKSKQSWQEDNNEGAYTAYLNELVGALITQMDGVDVEWFEVVAEKMLSKHGVRKFRLPRLMIDVLSDTHIPVVLSGSPEVLVWAFVADIDTAHVYGSPYEIKDGRFTGSARAIGNKALLLRELVEERGVVSQPGSVAMGDTMSDEPMLAYADRPVMFNASRALTSHGEIHGWDKAFEVKDNITILSKSPETSVYAERDIGEFLGSLKAES